MREMKQKKKLFKEYDVHQTKRGGRKCNTFDRTAGNRPFPDYVSVLKVPGTGYAYRLECTLLV